MAASSPSLSSVKNHSESIYMSKSGINYTESNLFYYERKFFDNEYVESKRDYMNKYWSLSIYYALVYVVVIFALQAFMRTRPKFDLRRPLIAWNFLLAAFSILGTVRVWPDFISTIYTKGILETMCSSEYAHGVMGAWSWYDYYLFIEQRVKINVDRA